MSDDNKEGAGVPVNEHSFVQPVPDHCDRITWRGHYYHLREATPPAVMPAAPSEIELQHREALDCLDSVMRAASHVLVGLAPSEKEAKLRSVLSKAHDWCMTERAALSQTMQPQAVAVAVADDFIPSVRRLCIAARTTGGTAGRDEGLCRILDRVEAMLEAMHSPEWKAMVAAPAAGEQAGAADREFAVLVNREACRLYPDSRDDRINFGDGARWARALAAPGAAIAAREQEVQREKAHEGPLVGDQIPVDQHAAHSERQSWWTESIVGDGLEVDTRLIPVPTAALTQPTTVQQAEQTDVVRELPEVECPKCELKVLRNCGGNCPIPNRDGATLKGMQPGERKDGVA